MAKAAALTNGSIVALTTLITRLKAHTFRLSRAVISSTTAPPAGSEPSALSAYAG
jgi:hypothetical protein